MTEDTGDTAMDDEKAAGDPVYATAGRVYEGLRCVSGYCEDDVDAIAAAIREAVAAEREWCAGIADGWSDTAAGRGIAESIREGAPAKPAPAWPKEPPTVPGWYWFRESPLNKVGAKVYRVVPNARGALWVLVAGQLQPLFTDGQWLGPIEVPA